MLGENEGDKAARQELGATGVENPSRRRFTRGGAAASVVLGSLASQPVLGTTSNYRCTISGKISGNLSRPDSGLNCQTLGRSPGYWKNKSWPSPFVKGSLPNGACQYSPVGTYFNGYTADGRTLANAFKIKTVNGACKVFDATESGYGTCTAKATMYTVIETGGGLNDTAIAALGRATVASLLNAKYYGYASGGQYPLTQGQIIDMFNAVYLGGLYQLPASSISWNRDQVKAYFESLYGAL